MKMFPILFATGVAGFLAVNPLAARADLEVSASFQVHAVADFEAPLSPCGAWVTVGSYGRCWHPTGVVVGWRPYCDGYWEWTDCGWYWVSDEPWAWACYHYGYWVDDSVYGWVWAPGVEWAPAWVSWRVGGGFIGWAPLPPPGVFVAHRPVDAAFVFVDNDHFSERIRPSIVVANNVTIINQTKYISNIRHVSRSFDGTGAHQVNFNEGPGLNTVQKATGKQFRSTPIVEAVHHTPMPRADSNRGFGHQTESYDRPENKRGPAAAPNEPSPHLFPNQQPAQRPSAAPADHRNGDGRPMNPASPPASHVQPGHSPAGSGSGPVHGHGDKRNDQNPDHGNGHGHGD